MNDTYGLPIMDITCCQPVCHFRPVGSLPVSWSLYVNAALGEGLKNWTIHIPSPTTVHTTSGKSRKSTVLVVDDIFILEISATDTATHWTNSPIFKFTDFPWTAELD